MATNDTHREDQATEVRRGMPLGQQVGGAISRGGAAGLAAATAYDTITNGAPDAAFGKPWEVAVWIVLGVLAAEFCHQGIAAAAGSRSPASAPIATCGFFIFLATCWHQLATGALAALFVTASCAAALLAGCLAAWLTVPRETSPARGADGRDALSWAAALPLAAVTIMPAQEPYFKLAGVAITFVLIATGVLICMTIADKVAQR